MRNVVLPIQIYMFAVGAVGQTLFVLIYVWGRWWAHYVGRTLFVKSFMLMLMMDVSTINIFFDYQYENQTKTTMITLVAVAIWLQLFAIIRQRREGHLEQELRQLAELHNEGTS